VSVVASRPWTSHEDIVLQRLAAAGKYSTAIAVDMHRSESAIRNRATRLKITLAKVRGTARKAKGK
jgi:DNA-binding NarL/FixJ family response regulator